MEDEADSLGFLLDNGDAPVIHDVAEGQGAAHPQPLALGGGDLVPNSFRCNLPLELGERQQHIEGQPSHRGRGIELLRHRDERHPVSIKQFHQFSEISE